MDFDDFFFLILLAIVKEEEENQNKINEPYKHSRYKQWFQKNCCCIYLIHNQRIPQWAIHYPKESA
jgi:hypothetical protein